MRNTGLRALTIALALSGAACQSVQEAGDTAPPADSRRDSGAGVPGSVQLTLDRSSYRAGAPVMLRLQNRSTGTLGYNPCTRTIEQQLGSGWTPFPEPGRMCTMELRMLEPSGSVEAQTELPATMPRGTYRMVVSLSDENGAQRAVSSPFTVE